MHGPKKCHLTYWHPWGSIAVRARQAAVSAALIPGLVGSSLLPARAETEVRGHLDALQVRAENASTREVLEALAASFKLTYKLPPNVDRNWNGLYSGSLHRVLARILHDTNYFIKSSNEGIEVIVLRAPGTDDAIGGVISSGAVTTNESIIAPPLGPATRPQPVPRPIPGATTSPPPLASYLPDN